MPGRESNASNLFLGRGKLWADVWTDQGVSSGGEMYLGVASVWEPQAPADETIEMRDYAVQDAPLLDKIAIKRDMKMRAVLHEMTLENLRMALLGNISARAQGTDAVTDEDLTAKLGYYVPLEYRKVSSVVVEPEAGGTAFTEDKDYILDRTTGRIYFMTAAEGGTITDAAKLHVSYNYAADTARTLAAGAALKVEGSLRFVGDPKRGQRYEMEVWHFQIAPEGGIGFISDDYGNITLNFDVIGESTDHPTAPYYLISEYTEYEEPTP